MHDNDEHNEKYRFHSSRWATNREMKKAGMFKKKGVFIGFRKKKAVYSDGDAPVLVFSGAGGGKLTGFGAYNILDNSAKEHGVYVDLKGELSKISFNSAAESGAHAVYFNPFGLHGLPQDRVNLFDLLSPRDQKIHANAQLIAETMIEFSGSGTGKFFELRGQAWLAAILVSLTLRDGYIDATNLMEAINSVEGDAAIKWAALIEYMLNSPHEYIRSIAGEMLAKQQDSPNQFGSFMAEIYAYTSVFNNPLVKSALSDPTFSMKAITSHSQITKIYIVIPAEYMAQMKVVIKLFGISTMLYKAQTPDSPRTILFVDEAAQLGKAEFLLNAFTYGRGIGLRTIALFQSIGQIKRNFDAHAVQDFMGSAGTRLFFVVRDIETAELVSKMVGNQTLEYHTLTQDQAALQKKKTLQNALLNGGDPIMARLNYQYYDKAAQTKSKQGRNLIASSEVLTLREDKLIAFVSGKNLNPMVLDKRPYYMEYSMAGKFQPNPYHPPYDKIRVKTTFGMRWKKIITEPIPEALKKYPQYSSGQWQYVEGYKPKIK